MVGCLVGGKRGDSMNYLKLREEPLKTAVFKDFFSDYDYTQIGNIDFVISASPRHYGEGKDGLPSRGEVASNVKSILWAEAKQGKSHDIFESFVQLILTIGKEKTFEKYLPPKYIGAFDAEKFAFIEYHSIQEVFYQPEELRKIVNDEEKRKKLVIYINPPYAEVSTKKIDTIGKKSKTAVNQSMVHQKYTTILGTAGRELFTQFFIRIYKEIPGCILGEFSTLKILQGSAFESFRSHFRAELKSLCLMPANTFDNVKGEFPIGFFIWDTKANTPFHSITADVYDKIGTLIVKKDFFVLQKKDYINAWISTYRIFGKQDPIGFLDGTNSNDFQHNNYVYVVNTKEQVKNPRGLYIYGENLTECVIYYAVRHCLEATWLNDRDQFLYPNDGWKTDLEFQSDCLTFVIFNNNISAEHGENHWIPFTEQEIGCKKAFKSHFMSDFIRNFMPGKYPKNEEKQGIWALLEEKDEKPAGEPPALRQFSDEAKAVFDAGRELWKYYHSQKNANPDASFYDIRKYFQGETNGRMNAGSEDEQYTALIAGLRAKMKVLAAKIAEKVYKYGFLK